MDLTDEVWHFIKKQNEVLDFLGGGAPAPLSEKEVEELVKNLRTEEGGVVHKYNIDCGDVVKITDGVFINLTGTVNEIFQDKGKLSVLVSIFGRDTRVDDLEMWQVEKITND
jgi:transcriptional antiterminator NusG